MEANPAYFSTLEVQVLDLLASGISLKEIERQLNRPKGSLNTLLTRKIYKKLGINNRYAAVIEAQTQGIIDRPRLTMDQALDVGRQATKILLYKPTITPEELAVVTKYRTLAPYMEEQIGSRSPKQALAGTAFTFRARGVAFAELSKRAHALWPEIYDYIGTAAEEVADKAFIVGAKYEARFNQTPSEE